jgi:cupin 2 domain-containing protein
MKIDNLWNHLPPAQDDELVTRLVEGENVRIERIVSWGQHSPDGFWYDQRQAEWVMVLSGGAVLTIEGAAEPIRMHPGDHLSIPAGKKHRVDWTDGDQPTVWLAVFFD